MSRGPEAALYVVDRGRGPPVVLIHGFTGSSTAWPSLCLDGLAAVSRVLAPDLPGHGRSLKPHDPAAYDLAVVARGLVAVLDDAAVDRATWIGYSMGGRVALAVAIHWPTRVQGLILESASPGLMSEAERIARRAADLEWAMRLREEGVGPFVERWMSQELFATQRRLGTGRMRDEHARRLRNDPAALAACLAGLGTGSQPSFWDRLPDVSTPVLLMTGELDAKFTGVAERMAAGLPDARHVRIAGAGHAVHLERPEDWLGQVVAFVAAAAAPGARRAPGPSSGRAAGEGEGFLSG